MGSCTSVEHNGSQHRRPVRKYPSARQVWKRRTKRERAAIVQWHAQHGSTGQSYKGRMAQRRPPPIAAPWDLREMTPIIVPSLPRPVGATGVFGDLLSIGLPSAQPAHLGSSANRLSLGAPAAAPDPVALSLLPPAVAVAPRTQQQGPAVTAQSLALMLPRDEDEPTPLAPRLASTVSFVGAMPADANAGERRRSASPSLAAVSRVMGAALRSLQTDAVSIHMRSVVTPQLRHAAPAAPPASAYLASAKHHHDPAAEEESPMSTSASGSDDTAPGVAGTMAGRYEEPEEEFPIVRRDESLVISVAA